MQRYKFFKDSLGPGCECSMDEHEQGSFVGFEDVLPLEKRVKELEEALKRIERDTNIYSTFAHEVAREALGSS